MRLRCPNCGERDRREFAFRGAAVALERPDIGESAEIWHSYLHLRDNPAGQSRELWYHEGGCGAWLEVHRDTATHEVHGCRLLGGRAYAD